MKSRFSKIFPAILLMGLLVSCAPPYHQKDERYIFVAFNTNLPYWQEAAAGLEGSARSEEHTSELQSQSNLVCRLLLEKKKNQILADLSAPLGSSLPQHGPRARSSRPRRERQGFFADRAHAPHRQRLLFTPLRSSSQHM